MGMGRWLQGQNRHFRIWTRVLELITQRYAYLCFLHRCHRWWILSSVNPRWFLGSQETSFVLNLCNVNHFNLCCSYSLFNQCMDLHNPKVCHRIHEITDMGLCHCLESLTLLDTLRGDISMSTQPFPQHSIVSSFLYLFALESPRWLHLQGNNEEAIVVLKSLSSKNKTYLESLVSTLPLGQETVESLPRILVVMIILFGMGMSYYGVPLAARDIDVNIYLSETLNAANLCSCEHLTRWSIVGALFRSKRFRKNRSATMMFRQALVVGGACCPLIASIGRDLPSVSFAIFGIAMSGLVLFVLILPETKGSSLCDTMEEQENRDQTISTSHVVARDWSAYFYFKKKNQTKKIIKN
ncbi:BnaA06g10980D [Brassica napus]|uniref:(rape) hypothetical protein n=1 Tax=Brassica napus TaxID=3708 RepID=A0A078HE55_BRANA|nr:unnamed protein product [Brassica napus]CDY35088.1 BnaA06g10980D [Brassica napus]